MQFGKSLNSILDHDVITKIDCYPPKKLFKLFGETNNLQPKLQRWQLEKLVESLLQFNIL